MKRHLPPVLMSAFLTITASAAEPELPKYGPAATRLFHAREFVRSQPAGDFWALMPYYVSQPDERSCSTAAVAMVVNALRAGRELKADEPLVTPADVLGRVAPQSWREKVGPGGDGVTLDELTGLLPPVLKAYGVTARAQRHRFEPDERNELQRLRRMLADNERSDRDFILVNVLQSELTGDPEGAVGHFAVVAAYDAQIRRVLIFDPDRRWYEPYWVSDHTLLRAMQARDTVSGRVRGLIWVSTAR